MPLACIFKIASRPAWSGISTTILLSNLPGLTKAGSSNSGLFVAAITTTLSFGIKPSISTKIWFKVCSRSSWPPVIPIPLVLPIASSSSMNIIDGTAFLAVEKRSLVRLAPTPTSISINSLPAIEKKGTLASPATAFANKVFPVPLGPIKSTPFGVLAPNASYFLACFKKSTTSSNSFLASSTPATSLKLVFCLPLENNFAFDLPKENIESCAPRIFLKIHKKITAIIIIGRTSSNILPTTLAAD